MFLLRLSSFNSLCCTLLLLMADGTSDIVVDPNISEDEESDDEVSLLVVDEDELQTALETAGISIKVHSFLSSCCCNTKRRKPLTTEHVAPYWDGWGVGGIHSTVVPVAAVASSFVAYGNPLPLLWHCSEVLHFLRTNAEHVPTAVQRAPTTPTSRRPRGFGPDCEPTPLFPSPLSLHPPLVRGARKAAPWK